MLRKLFFGVTTVFAVTILSFPAQARDRIQIVGSSTVYPFATVVASLTSKVRIFRINSFFYIKTD